ncbi:plasmid stabilization protein [Inquilinus sp. Marseille-Q2685]|uniref:FitA-like ribbon-helix-helix domain-containing protein n=1 Tax=Inquilinus sp. Marseille-Q2685 TaxID=2866581 RepID=UPI001CE43FCA|nr:plasmid stabilization protein [Inquilinus sp. Marseille-Q2685]
MQSTNEDAIIACNAVNEAKMPGNLSIRNVDDALIARLKRRAGRHGRSAEAELREILRQALATEEEPNFEDLAAQFRALTAGRHHTPAEELQREGRDER